MRLFSIPVVALPPGGLTNTPEQLPVVFEGEHVADGFLRDGSYYFRLFQGDLLTGLLDGKLLYRPRFRDTPAAGNAHTRDYLAVEIMRTETQW
jgi:hypothetical protein